MIGYISDLMMDGNRKPFQVCIDNAGAIGIITPNNVPKINIDLTNDNLAAINNFRSQVLKNSIPNETGVEV